VVGHSDLRCETSAAAETHRCPASFLYPKSNLVSLRPIAGPPSPAGMLAVVTLTDAPDVAALPANNPRRLGKKIRKAPMSFSRYTGLTHQVGS
jgi:hypothetical protein